MSEDVFDAGWLALREPVDHRSRAHELLDRLLEATAPSRLGRVVDLGGGRAPTSGTWLPACRR